MDVLKTLGKVPVSKVGLHYLFTIHNLQPREILRERSYNVKARIDMFALLRSMLLRILGGLDIKRMQSTGYLRTVSKVLVKNSSFTVILVLSRLCCLAAEDQCLDHGSLHLMVNELSQQWATDCNHIDVTIQRQ